MWDIFAAKSGNIQDGSNPSVATDFYNKYKEDIALMKAMGVKNFRSAAAAAQGAGALPAGTQQQPLAVAAAMAAAVARAAAGGGRSHTHQRTYLHHPASRGQMQQARPPRGRCTRGCAGIQSLKYFLPCTCCGCWLTRRMSISWSRLIPEGVAGSPVNPEAVKFYNSVFDELKKANIEPAVTLYHWDMPQVRTEQKSDGSADKHAERAQTHLPPAL